MRRRGSLEVTGVATTTGAAGGGGTKITAISLRRATGEPACSSARRSPPDPRCVAADTLWVWAARSSTTGGDPPCFIEDLPHCPAPCWSPRAHRRRPAPPPGVGTAPGEASPASAGRGFGPTTDAGRAARRALAAPAPPGAAGIGDPYFPLEGNGGFDVRHYDLTFSYDPATDRLDAVNQIRAVATQTLSRFDLDLQQLDVSAVTVNGKPATFTRDGQELQITPMKKLPAKQRFDVSVSYGGVPADDRRLADRLRLALRVRPHQRRRVHRRRAQRCLDLDPDERPPGRQGDLDDPRHRSRRPERHLQRPAAQPAHAQRPVDLRLERAVPDGELPRHRRRRQLGHPAGRTPNGIPETVAADPTLPAVNGQSAVDFFYDTTAEATDLWSQTFGPYPFDSTGAIADNANYNGQAIGFSLETQTRPLYSNVRSDLDDRPRAGPPVVRRQRLGPDVAQHLAQRGLRDLRAVPVGRAQGRKSAHDSFLADYSRVRPTRPSGRSRWPTRSATRCSPAPSTAAAA